LAPTASATQPNLQHFPELTMAPKFQKGPDLKRFMVRRMLLTIQTSLIRKIGFQIDFLVEKLVILSCLSFVSLTVSILPRLLDLAILYIRFFSFSQDKRLKVSINGNRKLLGTLRGYDAFLNVVLEDVESESGQYLGQVVVRGNSIIQFEGLERTATA
jgi:small nuclear ribonucleoprotein G